MASSSTRGILLSKISPRFLDANSTSHTWVFSAFAELIDNAYDPDVCASDLLIDSINIRGQTCLIFLDNGRGMDKDKLHKMLSFGFCEKEIYEKEGTYRPIGQYGNGFKSGSMRIGKDALVFTRTDRSACIGFLSQTFLFGVNAQSVVVPILEYRLPKMERYKSQESRNNLNAILEYSVFKHEDELKEELRALEGSRTGTKIIMFNLKRLNQGNLELDFSSDLTDIRCPEAHEADLTSVYHRPIQQYVSQYRTSLREYCSILFLKPRMKITIRGRKVHSKLISKSLAQSANDCYKPSWLPEPIKITFGFTCDKTKSEDYGLMLYHRNRLIKAYERVGCQRQANEQGVGVVGVTQVDCLVPTHNKQDFNKDEKYNSAMKAFAQKLTEYWNEKMGIRETAQQISPETMPDWTWAQCEQCLKWRRLPDSIDPKSLPEQWFCYMSPDGNYNRCDIQEEPEDEDLAIKPRFERTMKKKREEERKLLRLQEEKKKQEREKNIQEISKQLKAKDAELKAMQQKQERMMAEMVNGSLPPTPVRNNQQKDLRPSSKSGTPHKRAATVESLPSKENKKLCIKTETGEVLSITRNFADDEENAGPQSSSKSDHTPKDKLRVALPFHSRKGDRPASENQTDKPVAETDDTISSKTKNSVSSTEADSSAVSNQVKPDPDGGRQDSVDVKPDVRALKNGPTETSRGSKQVNDDDVQVIENRNNTGIDSMLDTALAAVREIADRERLGAATVVGPSSQPQSTFAADGAPVQPDIQPGETADKVQETINKEKSSTTNERISSADEGPRIDSIIEKNVSDCPGDSLSNSNVIDKDGISKKGSNGAGSASSDNDIDFSNLSDKENVHKPSDNASSSSSNSKHKELCSDEVFTPAKTSKVVEDNSIAPSPASTSSAIVKTSNVPQCSSYSQTDIDFVAMDKMKEDLNRTRNLLKESEETVSNLRNNIYKFLKLQAPEMETLGDIRVVDQLLENMIEIKQSLPDSQD